MKAFRLFAAIAVFSLAAPAMAQRVDPIDPWDPSHPTNPNNPPPPGPGPGPGPDFPGPNAYDLVGLAEEIQHETELLTQILFSDGGARSRLVYNAGLLAKEAHDVVLAAYGGEGAEYTSSVEQEAYEVLNAAQYLQDAVNYARPRPSYYALAQLQRVNQVVDALRYALGGQVVIDPIDPWGGR